MYEKFGQFIDGKWQPSEKNETYEVINPATEEILGHASKATPSDVDKALKSAEKGFAAAQSNATVMVRMARRWGCPLQKVTMRQRSLVLYGRKALRARRICHAL